ncbi:hypothetical protein BDV95DRAFT_317680 [Massariosphaeria phaeospora]|uniref:Ser-Thr-rich glycosyl-phosphatidyl-inositol-anchored membrane family-domain-containing protein n=1 Tax=Massariosphaeria phaeospora TaxID=100035 RepID=A0A7C8I9L3_9PLEO|nr:hypothetical protein BDV95DRAFT_317680 [Massariosphaeria phaeospora]
MRAALPSSSLLLLLALSPIFVRLIAAQTSAPPHPEPSYISQPILHPTHDDLIEAGGIFSIEWTPDSAFQNVTLEIWDNTSWGYSRDFGSLCYHWINPFCGTIVSHAPNTGTYEWHVPKPGSDFPRGEWVFWIKMYVDDFLHHEIGNTSPVLSYSQTFAFRPEPGQEIPTYSETESIPTPTAETSQATNSGSVKNSTTAMMSDPSATPTARSGQNATLPIPSQGSAFRFAQMVPSFVLLVVGLI